MSTIISAQQRAFFDTFGYLVIPGILAADMAWISEEYDAIYRSQAEQVVPLQQGATGAWASTINHLFVSMSPRLSTLIEDPRIVGICEGLLGTGHVICGGDGTIFHTNTSWHSDGWGAFTDQVRHIKVSCYLDPLTSTTGALRVIPGSQHAGDRYSEILNGQVSDPLGSYARPLQEVPCVSCETRPGDIVIFDWRTKHASFGGSGRRRLMCLNVHAAFADAQQRELGLDYWRGIVQRIPDAGWFPGFLESSPPERLRLLQESIELLAQARREHQEAVLSASSA
jgi:ectoine hydroxylase-related dioxygenase (phytanoyl-CoA dioxygenase family)